MIESEICLNNPRGQCKHVLTERWTSIRNGKDYMNHRCVLTGETLHKITLTDETISAGKVACSHFQMTDIVEEKIGVNK